MMKSTDNNFSGAGRRKGILAVLLAAIFSPAAVSDIGSINLRKVRFNRCYEKITFSL